MMKKLITLFFLFLIIKGYPQGIWQWVDDPYATNYDFTRSVTSDSSGNIYTTGFFEDTAVFDNQLITGSRYHINSFIVKYDGGGVAQWARGLRGNDNEGRSIAVGSNGIVYVLGSFGSDTLFADPFHMVNKNSPLEDIYLVALSANGNVLWGKNFGGNDRDHAHSITTDVNGNIIIAGTFSDTITFGTFTLTTISDFTFFVAKLDQFGNCFWALSGQGSGDFYSVSDIVSDNTGNVFAAGHCRGILTVGNLMINNSSDLSFLLKISPTGAPLKLNQLWHSSRINGIDLTGNYLVLAGTYSSDYITIGAQTFMNAEPGALSRDYFAVKMDTALNVIWANVEGGIEHNDANDIVVAENGNVFIIGTTYDFGPNPSSGRYCFFTQGFNPWGSQICYKEVHASTQMWGNGIAADPFGDVYVVGASNGNCYFDSLYFIPENNIDGFLAKLTGFPLDISNILPDDNFQIYPNPSHGRITIEVNEKTTVSVFNQQGKLIKEITSAAEIKIDFPTNGIYILKLKSKDVIRTRKVVIIE